MESHPVKKKALGTPKFSKQCITYNCAKMETVTAFWLIGEKPFNHPFADLTRD
jgi:hypothetical protein